MIAMFNLSPESVPLRTHLFVMFNHLHRGRLPVCCWKVMTMPNRWFLPSVSVKSIGSSVCRWPELKAVCDRATQYLGSSLHSYMRRHGKQTLKNEYFSVDEDREKL